MTNVRVFEYPKYVLNIFDSETLATLGWRIPSNVREAAMIKTVSLCNCEKWCG